MHRSDALYTCNSKEASPAIARDYEMPNNPLVATNRQDSTPYWLRHPTGAVTIKTVTAPLPPRSSPPQSVAGRQ